MICTEPRFSLRENRAEHCAGEDRRQHGQSLPSRPTKSHAARSARILETR